MTTFDISNETDFNNSISDIDTLGFPNNYVFDITGPITLTSQLLAINLPSGSSLTIEGTNGSGGAQVQTINGANAYNGFFVYSGDVTIENLTLQDMKAQGGGGGELAVAAPAWAADCSWRVPTAAAAMIRAKPSSRSSR